MITISLCMIVKNEETVLGRVLEQMREVADEMIIVDTGSEDETKRVAAEYTDRIYDFPWKQDFAAARNFACKMARMDYWMWLDADDVVPEETRRELERLKRELDPSVDVVMMRYVTGFDEKGRAGFSFYRERILKNHKGFCWEGRVHEAVAPKGRVIYLPAAIEHGKKGQGDRDRNLKIYEEMIQNGEDLGPRGRFYYGRELMDHGRYQEAARVFDSFLREPQGWTENKIDACLQLALCQECLKQNDRRLLSLLRSFCYGIPRPELCCELGRYFMEQNRWREAAFWYGQALEEQKGMENQEGKEPQKGVEDQKGKEPQKDVENQEGKGPQKDVENQKGKGPQKGVEDRKGKNLQGEIENQKKAASQEKLQEQEKPGEEGFVWLDSRGYVPAIQLCVCYDRLGDRERAWHYHKLAAAYKPDAPEVIKNEAYFRGIGKNERS